MRIRISSPTKSADRRPTAAAGRRRTAADTPIFVVLGPVDGRTRGRDGKAADVENTEYRVPFCGRP